MWDTGETRKVYSYFQGGYSRLEKIDTYTYTVTAYIYYVYNTMYILYIYFNICIYILIYTIK